MLDDFKQRGVKFRSLTEAIDTETPTGRAMWQMIGVLAELERSLIAERTRAGVKAAQRRGVNRVRERLQRSVMKFSTGLRGCGILWHGAGDSSRAPSRNHSEEKDPRKQKPRSKAGLNSWPRPGMFVSGKPNIP